MLWPKLARVRVEQIALSSASQTPECSPLPAVAASHLCLYKQLDLESKAASPSTYTKVRADDTMSIAIYSNACARTCSEV